MSLLVDLFGYLEIILHGLVILSQSMALGGVLFLVFLARPFVGDLPGGAGLLRRTAVIAGWSAVCLVVGEALTIALQAAVLVDTVDLPLGNVLHAAFAEAGMVKCVAALLLAVCLLSRRAVPASVLLALGVVELAAATLSTHAAARMSDSLLLLAVEALHQLGAAIWIGGIPCFLMALSRVNDALAWQRIGARFSRMSMVGVACILVSGVTMSLFYIGSWDAAYGTAYGVMVGAKVAMFGGLLLLGFGNFLVTERLRSDPTAPVQRLKRFAEVEIGIGISIFFAAASLTSVPPGVDLTQDRVTWHEVVERNTPDVAAPGLARLRQPRAAGAAGAARRGGGAAGEGGAARLDPRLRRAAAAQRGRHCLERVQPPLGRAVRAADRRAGAAQPGGGAVGEALAAGDARVGGVPAGPVGPRGLAAGVCAVLRCVPGCGGAAAPHVRGADHGVRAVRMGGADGTDPFAAGGAGVSAADGGRRGCC
ncbi:MAG: CopD family protein [Acetobacteraceae bacterium]